MSDTLLSRCRVVLVRPHYAGNLGSTARVMRNFGLSDLVLVAPYARVNNPEAVRLATHGLPVLEAARIVPDLGDAVADCVFTLATSALTAGVARRGMIGTPAELIPGLLDAAERGPVALVFGPEPHGLSNEEIGRCHGMLHVPVDPEFSSLNLAQAVAVCCYELRKAWSARVTEQRNSPPAGPAVAPHADQERMFEHLRDGLRAVGFLFGERQDTLMHAVRQLVGRSMPTPAEVRMLHGLARQLLWIASQQKPTEGETS
ncbi:rna methyltransferase : tRNA/rRNA methyltransferase OS=Anabaena sp. 90 GN=ANA_C10775 PE=4 SV=1: SpoU_methylase [Gemmataceae bacterium]|nr:rna methyltransferase : tRNA/rRNA methyltransferase OS=Anabaena sp. 90 GN=ANA_C10775 PE=4 SV=1: SpoU_methylase [Gemmataceae bacterium]VTU01404.1 rna methyltransferase : tRNA/rRNA methyltransferase OS=Anabaena sp. 90 GN=ANA_C10775 PE=4 SV=1: SpoU_methylase [Gemmataceae bacterium]